MRAHLAFQSPNVTVQFHGCYNFTRDDNVLDDGFRLQHGPNPEHSITVYPDTDIGEIVDWHLAIQRRAGMDECSPEAWSTD